MKLIPNETLHGGENIKLTLTLLRLLSLATMAELRANGEKRMTNVKIAVTSQEE